MAAMNVISLFYEDEGNFQASDYIDEILSIICDGQTKQYDAWSVYATIDATSDTCTVYASK